MNVKSIALAVLIGAIFCCVAAKRQKREWYAGADINTAPGGRYKVGGHIGYQGRNWHVRGSGWRDSSGNYGVGASFGVSWKRGLPQPKGAFVLRLEANPCSFETYDDDADGIITPDDMSNVFPDPNLGKALFEALDVNDEGGISEEVFNAARKVIANCAETKNDQDK